MPILEAVEVRVSSPVPAGDDTIILTVREGTIDGTPIATASQFLVDGFQGWVYFTLTPVSVTPESTYVIRLQATKTTFLWCYGVGDPYPRGVAIESGTGISGQDFAFRTYGSTHAPVGTPVGTPQGVIPPEEMMTGTPPQDVLDIFHEHIMGEQMQHQGGNKVPVKGGAPGSPSRKPIGGITAPRNVNPLKLTGGEGVGNL